MDLYYPISLNYEQNKIDINLKSNLRKGHFSFYNEDNPNNRISLVYNGGIIKTCINQINYIDPKLCLNYSPINYKTNIDINKYKRNNWTISNGDEKIFLNHHMDLQWPQKNQN